MYIYTYIYIYIYTRSATDSSISWTPAFLLTTPSIES